MGTKIQCKTYLPAFYSVKDLNGRMNNGACLLNREEQTLRSVHHYDFFASCMPPVDGYFEYYDKEKVRQTILKHESIFRHQLQELHRLHRRQMELMNELKTRGFHGGNAMKAETLRSGHLFSPCDINVSCFPSLNSGDKSLFEFIKRDNRTSHNGNTTTILEFSKRTNCLADLNEPVVLEEAPILASDANLDRTNRLIERMDRLSRNHIMGRDIRNGFENVQSVSGTNKREHSTIDINADVQSGSLLPSSNTKTKKKTIFGVVISEGTNEEPFVTVSNAEEVKGCSSVGLSYPNGKSIWNVGPKECRKYETTKSLNGLPWFIVESQQRKPGENDDQENFDLSKNRSPRRSERNEDSRRILNKKQEAGPSTSAEEPEHMVKKIFGVPIFDLSTTGSSFAGVCGVNSNNALADEAVSRNQIDLNLSLDEEESLVAEIAADYDEAPTVLKSEKNLSPEAESGDRESEVKEPHEETVREAAEAIVSISESAATECLEWLAELVTNEHEQRKGGNCDEDGMDDFESATLELRDMNEEGGRCYEPSISEVRNDDEEIGVMTQLPKRPRRGQARRGRQRKADFQRDVLPSIVSLSRHELNEDILTFEELLRTTGCSWQSRKKAAKSVRGRRRCGPPVKTVINRPLGSETEVEMASLTGWGKRTRRLPRQRCLTSNHVPLVQC